MAGAGADTAGVRPVELHGVEMASIQMAGAGAETTGIKNNWELTFLHLSSAKS